MDGATALPFGFPHLHVINGVLHGDDLATGAEERAGTDCHLNRIEDDAVVIEEASLAEASIKSVFNLNRRECERNSRILWKDFPQDLLCALGIGVRELVVLLEKAGCGFLLSFCSIGTGDVPFAGDVAVCSVPISRQWSLTCKTIEPVVFLLWRSVCARAASSNG